MNTITPTDNMRVGDAPQTRTGYSLLEVVLASTLCAAALVPALASMRDGMTLAHDIDSRHLLLLYGVSKMEEQLALVAALGDGWPGSAPAPGNFAADGHANIRYSITWSDNPAGGGITGRLMTITVTTYRDDNGNSALDAGELRNSLTTKISRLSSYESMAGE